MQEVIMKRFSDVNIPLGEMEEFFRVPEKWIPGDRPFVVLTYVLTADGKASFRERGYSPHIGLSGPGIAGVHLKHRTEAAKGSEADWRTVQYDWGTADAVVGASGIINAQPDLVWEPTHGDILEYRKSLGKRELPLQVVVTGRGLGHEILASPMFTRDDLTTVIATSSRGYEAMRGHSIENFRARFERFGDEVVDVQKMLRKLRESYDVGLVDFQGGSNLANQFLHAGMIDESRVTKSPFYAGDLNSAGEKRPGMFEGEGYDLNRLPVASPFAVGVYGAYLFVRRRLDYSLFEGAD